MLYKFYGASMLFLSIPFLESFPTRTLHITPPFIVKEIWLIQFEHSDLVLWCHYVPGAGDTSWVVLLRPVGCFESPCGFVQSASTVLVPCGVIIKVNHGQSSGITWKISFLLLEGKCQDFIHCSFKGTDILWSWNELLIYYNRCFHCLLCHYVQPKIVSHSLVLCSEHLKKGQHACVEHLRVQ